MAVVGVGTASATTLSTDAAGTVKYAVGQETHWSIAPGSFIEWVSTGGSEIATCTESTTKGSIEGSNTGTSVGGSIAVKTWGGCSQTTDNLALGSLSITKTGTDEGSVVGKGSKVTLGVFGVSCVYGTGEGTTLGTIKGGEAPELVVNAALPKIEGGFLCPGSAIYRIREVVTTPHALHIVS
jgi:hypothetical protein